MLLRDDVIERWAKDPDLYSSGITNAPYVMISRTFAPPEQRLKSLIARMKLMPNAPRRGPQEPRQPATGIHRDRDRAARRQPRLLRPRCAAAFAEVKDAALLAEFKTANGAVIAALDDYKKWLQNDLLNRDPTGRSPTARTPTRRCSPPTR